MQRFFARQTDPDGCLAVDRLVATGHVGNTGKSATRYDKFNADFLGQFRKLVASDAFGGRAATIVMNWHVRWANSAPNGQTGKGLNSDLMDGLKAIATQARKRLAMVYTIHEYTEGSDYSDALLEANGVVGLNRQIVGRLRPQFTGSTYSSVVPGLMTSMHTGLVDRIMDFLPRAGDQSDWRHELATVLPLLNHYRLTDLIAAYAPDVQRRYGRAMVGAHLLQRFRVGLRQQPKPQYPGALSSSIAIFGMVQDRHAMAVSEKDPSASLARNIQLLIAELNAKRVHRRVEIILAGKPPKPPLAKALKAISSPRFKQLGLVNSLDQLAFCKYAISFDHAGFRENASAMVNMIRNGQLMFSCEADEYASDFARRVAQRIFDIENQEAAYRREMLHQHHHYMAHDGAHVGAQLDRHFRSIVRGLGAASTSSAAAASSVALP
jgi:hypothetical protein